MCWLTVLPNLPTVKNIRTVTESMLTIPSDELDLRSSLRQFEYVPTESSQEVEMTRLTRSRVSLQEFRERDQMSLRGTQCFGPTVQQLARYGMPRMTARMLSGMKQFVSSRSQKSCVVRLVRSRWFALAASSLIILNAMFMGVTSDWTTVSTFDAFYTLQGDEQLRIDVATPQWASIGEVCFTILFATELSLRMYVEEIAFFCGDDLALNLLDVAMVTAGIIELAASYAGIGEESIRTIRMLRMLRLLRTLRSVRILRYLRFFSKFRLLALAMQKSLVPFFWACFMLLSMLYVVGVFFLNGVAYHIASGKAHPSQVCRIAELVREPVSLLADAFHVHHGRHGLADCFAGPEPPAHGLRSGIHLLRGTHDARRAQHHCGYLRQRCH